MNKVIVFSRFKSLLLFLLLLCGSYRVSFVDSFGSNDDENTLNNKSDMKPINSVLNDFMINVDGDDVLKRKITDYDIIINFAYKFLYLFGFVELRANNYDSMTTYIIPLNFFSKDVTMLNFLVNILTLPCYNFFSMKHYNIPKWLPLNSNNFYLGITKLDFVGDGIAGIKGEIVDAFLGRVALVWNMSSLLNYSFVKNKLPLVWKKISSLLNYSFVKNKSTFTIIGVRPLWLMLCLLQRNKKCNAITFGHFKVGDKKADYMKIYDPVEVNSNKVKALLAIWVLGKFISCFQIFALEFEIAEHFFIQFCVGNIIIEKLINKLFFCQPENILMEKQ